MEVERLNLGARIQDREGGGTIYGLLFESRDDFVRQGMRDQVDRGVVDFRGLVQDPGVEELDRTKLLVMESHSDSKSFAVRGGTIRSVEN